MTYQSSIYQKYQMKQTQRWFYRASIINNTQLNYGNIKNKSNNNNKEMLEIENNGLQQLMLGFGIAPQFYQNANQDQTRRYTYSNSR